MQSNAESFSSEALELEGMDTHDGAVATPTLHSNSMGSATFLNVLQNELVMEELVRFLKLEDIKSLSLMSREAVNAVRKTKVFADSLRELRFYCEDPFLRLLDGLEENTIIPYIQSLEVEVDGWSTTDLVRIPKTQFNLKKFLMHGKVPERLSIFTLKAVKDSEDFLEELVLPESVWKLEGIKTIHCKELKKLTLDLFPERMVHENEEIAAVEGFLGNQPTSLEELALRGSFRLKLLAALQGRLSNLRKLDITINRWWYNLVDPGFLKTMVSLEELSISMDVSPTSVRSHFEELERLLLGIPANDLKNISIIGKGHDNVDTILGKHLSRFRNLTELYLYKFAVDDDILQEIIKCCPSLTKLTLAYTNFTDFAISGIRTNRWGSDPGTHGHRNAGVSLRDLKGEQLRNEIILHSCNNAVF